MPGTFLCGDNARRSNEIEVFYDLLCSDCRDHWPALRDAISAFDPGQVSVKLVLMPLPYFTYSFHVSRVAAAVQKISPALFPPFITEVFLRGDQFKQEAFDKSESEVVDSLTDLGAKKTSADNGGDDDFRSLCESDTLRRETIKEFKYACSRAVTNTPTVLLNGNRVEEAENFRTCGDWESLVERTL
mmetsp:Transcript_12734/g.39055  ORF Transcript_12734/g.39055 Transcript_12734/m.39055 type:complete len:187 (-) Transcript_12734:158-718(-)